MAINAADVGQAAQFLAIAGHDNVIFMLQETSKKFAEVRVIFKNRHSRFANAHFAVAAHLLA
jgi:hypothetical protein